METEFSSKIESIRAYQKMQKGWRMLLSKISKCLIEWNFVKGENTGEFEDATSGTLDTIIVTET